MASNDSQFQRERIERLALRECPNYTLVFDEQSAEIRFSLFNRATTKRSGNSVAATAPAMREKDDARLKKLLLLMAAQCER